MSLAGIVNIVGVYKIKGIETELFLNFASSIIFIDVVPEAPLIISSFH